MFQSVRGGESGWGSAKRKPSRAPGEKDTWEPKVSTVRVERSRRSVVVEGRARVRDFERWDAEGEEGRERSPADDAIHGDEEKNEWEFSDKHAVN